MSLEFVSFPEYRNPYELTPEVIQMFPIESRRWEDLIKEAKEPEYRGCLSCKFYGLVPPEEIKEEVLPWRREIRCLYDSEDVQIRTGCHNWRSFR